MDDSVDKGESMLYSGYRTNSWILHELSILSSVFLAGKFVCSALAVLVVCNVLRIDSPLTTSLLG